MPKIICLYTDSLKAPYTTPDGENLLDKTKSLYPEQGLSTKEQQAFNPDDWMTENNDDFYIVTNSPFIVSCFKSLDVYSYDSDNNSYHKPEQETYGASFDNILTNIVGLDVLIAEKPLKEIKSILFDYDEQKVSADDTLKHLKRFGNSFELNYRRNKLIAI